MEIINALLQIIENPNAKKGYADFKKYLENQKMSHESNAIQKLINEKFGNKPDNISINPQ